MSEWKRTSSKRQTDFTDSDRLEGYHARSHQQCFTSQSSGESSSPPSSHEDRRSQAADRQSLFTSRPGVPLEAVLTHLEALPRATITSCTRPFLSPTNPAVYTLPPISLLPPRQLSHASHYVGQNFERETKDTTVETLKCENSSLICAYSSAQSRIADFEEAAQASKMEIAKLTKERQRLQAKIDVLEAEIDELQNSIEVSQQHTAAKDAQYSHILEMSTRLQSRSASDSQQWKAGKEQWAREKRDMQEIIAKLRSEVKYLQLGLSNSTTSYTDKFGYMSETSSQSIPMSTDPVCLEQHSQSLQYATASMEAILVGVRKEQAQLAEYVEKLGTIGRNLQNNLRSVSALDSESRLVDGD